MFTTCLWLFSITHCHLEAAGWIASDDCEQTAEATPVSGDPCDTGCKVLEKAPFKADNLTVKVAFVALVLSEFEFSKPDSLQYRVIGRTETLVNVTPLPLFVARTALPARAPSFLS